MTVAEDKRPGAAVDTRPMESAALPRVGRRTLRRRVRQALEHRELRRVVAFLFAGGTSAVVTLAVTSVLHEVAFVPFLVAAVCGTELGILVNFTVNDVVSFRDLAGHRRSFPVRLLRFHATCAVGQSLILALSVLLHDTWHWRAVVAQAVPIVLVTAVNFSLHRFWTYRGARAQQ